MNISARMVRLGAVLLAMIAAPPVDAQEAGIAIGARAPVVAVEMLDGQATDLSQYLGKGPVVMEFWATWCPLCRKLEPALQAARVKHGSDVTFIAVGVRDNQTPEKQRAYATDKQMGGVMVFDRGGKAVAGYKVPHTSYLVAVDASGTVVYTGVGAEQDVESVVAKAMGKAVMPESRP